MRKYTLLISIAFAISLGVRAQGDHPGEPIIKWIGDDQTINCTSNLILIGANVHNWQQGFEYLWSDGNTDSVRLVRPSSTTLYRITVTNPSLEIISERSFEIEVSNDPVVLSDAHMSVDKNVCPGTNISLKVDLTGGYAPYHYQWSHGAIGANPIVNPTEASTYEVTVTDRCGSVDEASVSVAFTTHDLLEAPELQQVNFKCAGTALSLEPDLSAVIGGVGYGYYYTFSTWEAASTPIEVITKNGELINYQITDACGKQSITGTIELVQEILIAPEVEPITCCKNTPVFITESNDAFYFWDGGQMHTEYASEFSKNAEVSLSYIDECGEMKELKREVEVTELNSDFNLIINHLDRKVEAQAPLLEDGSSIQWYVNGVKASTAPHAEFELTDATENTIALEIINDEGCTEKTVRKVVLQDGVELPSAFSPNGDGINDFFTIRFEDVLEQFDIKIFDRWGQLIYHSRDQYFAWDGKVGGQLTPLATYAYILNATTVTGRTIKKQGTISTLITD